jgi:hypothetical protein
MASTQNSLRTLAALASSAGWNETERQQRTTEFCSYVERLGNVSRGARKLLALVAEQAPQEQQHEALMPRLHEGCGLDPEEMDRYLHELRDANLIRIDGQYPFEQIAPAMELSGWSPTESLAAFAKFRGVNLREALGELDFSFSD